MMKARMRNGKILTGKIAEIFLRIGVAEPVEEIPQADEPTKPKHTVKRSAPKKGGRPKKTKK